MSNHQKHLDDLAVAAVDANEPDELALDAEECVSCNVQYGTFTEAAAFLASGTITVAPFALRNQVLKTAFTARQPHAFPVAASTPLDAYMGSVAALDVVLTHMSDDLWRKRATTIWNIQEVVTHLRVVDAIATNVLDLSPKAALTRATDIEPMTRDAISKIDRSSPENTYHMWRAQTETLIRGFRAMSPDTPNVTFLETSIPAESVLADRAFETWVHTQDIRRALGLQFKTPAKADLRVISDLCVRLLPFVLDQMPHDEQGSVQLVLSGDAGGSWVVPARQRFATDEPSATLTLDPVDFCLYVGNRLELGEFPYEIDGDEAPAKLVLQAAPMLSRI